MGVKVIKGSELPVVTDPSSAWLLGQKIIDGEQTTVQLDFASINNQYYATLTTIPISEGFFIYNINKAGVYSHFLDEQEDPIEVSTEEINKGIVQIWVDNGVSQKVTKEIDVIYPIMDTDFFNY